MVKVYNMRCTKETLQVAGFHSYGAKQEEDVDSLPHRGNSTHRAETLTFDMDDVSPAIANMFRRLMITEVPVLAFDRILIEHNDGILPDELLAHRIGLCPLAGPVESMQYVTESHSLTFDNLDPDSALLFHLDVTARREVPATSVYSGDLKWQPLNGQEELAASSEDNRVFLVHPDIVLTRLGPGQRLKLRAVAIKGIGAVHAKWTPVAACFYEMKRAPKEPDGAYCNVSSSQRSSSRRDAVKVNEEEAEEQQSGHRSAPTHYGQEPHREAVNEVLSKRDTSSVRFTIESIGQLSAADVFRQALILFAERTRCLAAQIRSTEPSITGAASDPPFE